MNRTAECECGNEKGKHSEACERCTYLDGVRATAMVIAALRRDGKSLTTEQLISETRLPRETIYRMVKRLITSGRIRKFEDTHVDGMCAIWKYALTEAAHART